MPLSSIFDKIFFKNPYVFIFVFAVVGVSLLHVYSVFVHKDDLVVMDQRVSILEKRINLEVLKVEIESLELVIEKLKGNTENTELVTRKESELKQVELEYENTLLQ